MPSNPRRPISLAPQDGPTVSFAAGAVSQVPAARIKVLVACDDPLLAAGIEATLSRSSEFELLASAHQPHGLPQLPSVDYADVTVTDYGTALKMLEVLGRELRVLVLTAESREASIRHALERGVRGYLMLGCSPLELLEALRTVSRGGTSLGPLATARIAESRLNQPLTSRELEVLRILMVGFSNKAIANQLAVSVGTVKTHVKSILSKLEAGSRTEAAAIAQRRGIVSDEALRTSQRVHNASIQRVRARSNGRSRAHGWHNAVAHPRSSVISSQSSTIVLSEL